MVGPFEKGLLTCQRFKRRHNFFSCKTHPHVCVTFIRKPSGPLTLPGLHYWLLTGGAGQRGDPRCPINHLFSTAAYFQSFLFSFGTKKKIGGGDGTGVRHSSLRSVRTRGPLGGNVGRRPLEPRRAKRLRALSLLPTYWVARDGTIVLHHC